LLVSSLPYDVGSGADPGHVGGFACAGEVVVVLESVAPTVMTQSGPSCDDSSVEFGREGVLRPLPEEKKVVWPRSVAFFSSRRRAL
jgi:hypothetical protein